MEKKFLFLGLLANTLAVLSFFGDYTIGDSMILALGVIALLASASFTGLGLLKRGSMTADVAGGILLGTFPVWVFGIFFIYTSYVAYLESLAFCRDYQAGYASALERCIQAQGFLYFLGLLAASLGIASLASGLALRYLRKSSYT